MNDGFWRRVMITPACWLWTGTKTGKFQYGSLIIAGRRRMAHRVSYELHHGPIPDGLVVRHKCDNPPCVNPDHLELGTHAENVADRVNPNRWLRRDLNVGGRPALLTDEQVAAVRALPPYSRGGVSELAERFGVSPRYLYQLRMKNTTRRLKGETA